jgi:hypothetical protein
MTNSDQDVARIVRDPLWLPHRYDPEFDAVHFVKLSRADHRAMTFLIEAEIPADAAKVVIDRRKAVAAAASGRLNFVFHSAYCCSTLLCRALDFEGKSMSLKEPLILNDVVGWRRRGGAEPRFIAEVLDSVATLISQPFSAGESVVVKPSNIINGLATGLLAMRSDSNAILLYAPLRVYLGSIAKKGMWGRLWVREFFIAALKDGLIDLGFSEEQYMGQTDLQIAAVGWLAQQALFAQLIQRFGGSRVRALNSEMLVGSPEASLKLISELFGLGFNSSQIETIATGPAFSKHSKSDVAFDRAARTAEHNSSSTLHADEIEKVAIWIEEVARSAGISLSLPS